MIGYWPGQFVHELPTIDLTSICSNNSRISPTDISPGICLEIPGFFLVFPLDRMYSQRFLLNLMQRNCLMLLKPFPIQSRTSLKLLILILLLCQIWKHGTAMRWTAQQHVSVAPVPRHGTVQKTFEMKIKEMTLKHQWLAPLRKLTVRGWCFFFFNFFFGDTYLPINGTTRWYSRFFSGQGYPPIPGFCCGVS